MEEIKKNLEKYYNISRNFLSQKKVQNIIVIILLLATLFLGAYIRVQPLPNLIDSTTGDYTPLALDPYYFLRVSETIVETGGDLPEVDSFRSPHLNVPWTSEILPESTVWIYKSLKLFSSEVTLNFAAVMNPVIFFILGLIVFFLLSFVITKNKWLSLIASFLVAIIPPYLYRTLAGFSDHESIGMFGFFLAILFFSWGLLYTNNKKSKKNLLLLGGFLAGFSTMFAIASWGGGAKFLFMIFPLAFLINWFTKKEKSYWNNFFFYLAWIVGVFVFIPIFGYNFSYVLKSFMFNSTGILTLFTLGFILIESIIVTNKFLPNSLKKLKQNPRVSSFAIVFILGALIYQIFVGNFFNLISSLLQIVIDPFGTERVTLTVAENKQPYLNDWISQISQTVFYIFLGGCLIVGGKLAKGIKNKKFKPLFIITFAFFILGILFSRVSTNSIFNGENFISKAFFFISFLVWAISTIYIYLKSEWKIDTKWIIIVAWMIPMLLAVRSAIRVFFAIVPFVAFLVPLALFEVGKWSKRAKEGTTKLLGYVLLAVLIIALISTSIGFYENVKAQATYQAPSYNSDWQNSMSWVRDNTPKDSLFLHWWDYGYWVQTGGDRATVTDGGHSQTSFGDHLVGRYVLTTPYPETAKSFMKSHGVSHLLIDSTDIGKYGAYSSIGDDNELSDRSSFIVTFVSNPSEIQETRNETIRFYRGGIYLDGDIYYEGEEDLFLPEGKAIMGGILLSRSNTQEYSQPYGLYMLNGKQYSLPMRYLFVNGELHDFEEGINATAYIYPNVYDAGASQQFDLDGAAMYLSEKTMNSLIVKLYLMNDPNDEYEELELVHEQSVYPFKFYYQGFRGPISIWKVNDMPEILTREEFTRIEGEYGEFDNLEFIK